MVENFIAHTNDYAWTLALLASSGCTLATAALVGLLAYRRVRGQKLRLDTAIQNICQGLTMFDKSGRLTLCNERYIDMYGLSREIIKPGCSVRQVVEHRIETGSLTAEEAQHT
jgi:PAS domain-containing protein